MNASPLASVIIPTKNPGKVFQQVLAAVLEQAAPFDFDVLIVDSGSKDGTIEWVRNGSDPRVRLHQIEPAEFGHGKTRNLGISMTRGRYAVMLTHDACPASADWLANLVRMAESDDRIAGVFGRHIAYPEANGFTASELDQHFSGFKRQPVVGLDDMSRYASDVGYRQFLHFFSDNNALVRRSVWQSIPYPDVQFAEDQIWAKTIIEAGWRKAYADNAVVLHSHEYGLVERLQRSFDESLAFSGLFQYNLCPSVRALLRSWLALTRRDWVFAARSSLWREQPGATARVPLDHFMRVLGHYLGARGERMSPAVRERLSRDRRLLAGLPLNRR